MTEFLNPIRTAVRRVAPDVDLDTIDLDEDWRDAAGLDSMDFLNVMIAIRELTGVDVPERDYPSLASLRSFADYLGAHVSG